MIYSLSAPRPPGPNEKFWGHICRTLLVWQLSSLLCNYVCFVPTTETICEVHVGLLLVCACVNGVVHNMHNVFTVLYVSQPCAQFWKTPFSAIHVLPSLQNTQERMYVFFTAIACTVQCLHMCRVLQRTACSLVPSHSSFMCVFSSVLFIFNGPNSQECLLVRKYVH